MALFGPSADKVLEQGDQTTGVVTGIYVRYTSNFAEFRNDSDKAYPLEHFAVAVGPKTYGIRQSLFPADLARLGMTVTLRVLGDAAVIDWPATLAPSGLMGLKSTDDWKMMKDPPAPGVVDDTLAVMLARQSGVGGTARITAVVQQPVAFGLDVRTDFEAVIDVPGQASFQGTIKRAECPSYASHLEREGAVVPVWVDGDKVTVDWPFAAMHDPGVGQPPGQEYRQAVALGTIDPTLTSGAAVRGQIAAADTGERVGGITLQQMVAVEAGIARERIAPAGYDGYAWQHGVPPGTWAMASAAWRQRMMTDWKVGAAYAEALAAAMKNG